MNRPAASTTGTALHRWCVPLALLGMTWLLLSIAAQAEQPRDFILDFQPTGTFVLVDYFGTGAQLTLEHRDRIYGNANDVTVATGIMPVYPEVDVFSRADLRVLFFGIGATVAYRAVFRDLVFEPGKNSYCERCDRPSRRARDSIFGNTTDSERFPYAEARASLFFPFNEHVVMQSTAAARYEGRRDRSYDWLYTSIYDHGVLGRWETELFVKDKHWGGIGPYLQLLYLPRAGHHDAQWAFGFNAVTRLGLVARNDLLFLTFLARPGDRYYGQHNYFAPVRALLVYRLILDL